MRVPNKVLFVRKSFLFFLLPVFSIPSQLRAQDPLATIKFYRPVKTIGQYESYEIKLGDAMVGRAKSNSVIIFRTEPGDKIFKATTTGESSFRLIAEAGKTYFVECGIGEGVAAGKPTFRLSSATQAEKEIAVINNTREQDLYSQTRIKLTKTKSNKVLILERGMRVAYVIHGAAYSTRGILMEVGKTSFVVDNKKISYSDLSAIGKRRQGSGFVQTLYSFLGAGSIVSGLSPAPTPQCNGCQNQSSGDGGAAAVGVLLGAGFITLAINTGIKNSLKDVLVKWKLEVIE